VVWPRSGLAPKYESTKKAKTIKTIHVRGQHRDALYFINAFQKGSGWAGSIIRPQPPNHSSFEQRQFIKLAPYEPKDTIPKGLKFLQSGKFRNLLLPGASGSNRKIREKTNDGFYEKTATAYNKRHHTGNSLHGPSARPQQRHNSSDS